MSYFIIIKSKPIYMTDKVLALQGSAITSKNDIAYHGSTIKVEHTAIRGKLFTYYQLVDGNWIEITREELINIINH
jgi:hypothetical protein